MDKNIIIIKKKQSYNKNKINILQFKYNSLLNEHIKLKERIKILEDKCNYNNSRLLYNK